MVAGWTFAAGEEDFVAEDAAFFIFDCWVGGDQPPALVIG